MAEVALPAGTLHYRDTGGGPPVVFLHGAFQDGRVWDPLADLLRAEFRCLTPDLPLGAHRTPMRPGADVSAEGVGRLVGDFLDALDLREVTLVGNDTGGAIAQIVAARHPARLGRLVLTSCEAFDNFPPPLFRALAPAARLGVLSALLTPMRLRAARRLPSGFGWLTHGPLPHHLIDDWIGAYFASSAVRRDTRSFVASFGNRRLMLEVAGELPAFSKPSLVAWAADDKHFPVEHATRLGQVLPDSRVAVVDDSRTWVMVDQPHRTAALIEEFVRSTATGSMAT